uniref:Uncharacterized protein n=1 Tax=Rhizophora mucronata TaxID=61149 RepID=A0A2P2QJT2_RHIMU
MSKEGYLAQDVCHSTRGMTGQCLELIASPKHIGSIFTITTTLTQFCRCTSQVNYFSVPRDRR